MTKFSRMRVQLTRILLPVVTVFLCVLPGQSYAFVPAAVGGYGLPTLPTSGSYAAASGSAPLAVGAAAFAVGMALGYYGLEYLLGDGTPQHVRVPLTTDPAKAVPAPSAPASANQGSNTVYGAQGITGTFGDAGTACNAEMLLDGQVNNWTGGSVTSCPEPSGSGSFTASFYYSSCKCTGTGTITKTVSVSCPAGYSVSGSSCVLSDARAVTPDNNCDFARSGSTLANASAADPDCAAALLKMPFYCSGGTCTGQGVDSKGNLETWSITPRADGGSTIQTVTQSTVNGQTQVQTTTAGVSQAGVVDSVSGSVQAGNIPASSGGAAPAPVTSTNPLEQPQPVQSVQFPSDYARTGEAASAATQLANAVNPKLDTIHHDLSDTTTATDPTVPTISDMPTWGNTFDALKGWTVPGHSSVCPTPSLDLSGFLGPGNVFVMNSHCTLLDNNKATLQGVMTAVFTVLALFLVLRA